MSSKAALKRRTGAGGPAGSSAEIEDADRTDAIWERLRIEAHEAARRDQVLATLIHTTVLKQGTLAEAVVHRVAQRLDHPILLPAMAIREAFFDALDHDHGLNDAIRADIAAVMERDPATKRHLEPVLYFKGFHALQTHRLTHWLWNNGRQDFALYLQSRASEVFQTDIHPAVPLGRGIFLDHATGLVVGETAVIEDNVSLLQGVTLGGTGKQSGDRHPKIREGVLIASGAKLLGNIEVGQCARIGAGAVVLKSVPPRTTVAGVPARVIGTAGCQEPARTMDQIFRDSHKV